jgi:hypothetical protein
MLTASRVERQRSHRPVCLSRNVGTPLSADTPAPVRTTTRLASRSDLIIVGSTAFMRLGNQGWWHRHRFATTR